MTTTASKRCDVYRCDEAPVLDLRRHIRVTGLTGVVRFLCREHATGRISPKFFPKYQIQRVAP